MRKPVCFLLGLGLISQLFFACTKESEQIIPIETTPTETTITGPACRLTKFYNANNPSDSSLYIYDIEGRLLQKDGFYNGKEKSVTNYEYNPQGQIVKLTVKEKYLDSQQRSTVDVTDVYTFEYDVKGQVTKYEFIRTTPASEYFANPTSPYQVIYEYDNEGNRIKSTKTIFGMTTTTIVTVFTYQGGNCIKQVFNPGESERIFEYEYYMAQEDKQVLFYLPTHLMGQTPNKNMLKKTIITDKKYPDDFNSIEEYSYEFNEKGFPTTSIAVYTSKNANYIFNIKGTYECQ